MNTNLKSIYHKVDLCVVGGGLAGMCASCGGTSRNKGCTYA